MPGLEAHLEEGEERTGGDIHTSVHRRPRGTHNHPRHKYRYTAETGEVSAPAWEQESRFVFHAPEDVRCAQVEPHPRRARAEGCMEQRAA